MRISFKTRSSVEWVEFNRTSIFTGFRKEKKALQAHKRINIIYFCEEKTLTEIQELGWYASDLDSSFVYNNS